MWPTTETFKYFPYFNEVSYAEKLMGESQLILLMAIGRLFFSDAYEYYYGDHRSEGQELLREYCQMKTHLRDCS